MPNQGSLPDKFDHQADSEPLVLLARGNLKPADKRLVTTLLRRLGMRGVSYFSEDEYQEAIGVASFRADFDELPDNVGLSKQPYHFANLKSRDDFLVKEHVDHFVSLLPVAQSKGIASRIFNHLVDSDVPRGMHTLTAAMRRGDHSQWQNPHPPEGIVITPRNEAGYAPYQASQLEKASKSSFCVAYAVQVGSIMDFDPTTDYTLKTMTKTRDGIASVIAQLNFQIDQ